MKAQCKECGIESEVIIESSNPYKSNRKTDLPTGRRWNGDLCPPCNARKNYDRKLKPKEKE